MTTNAQQESETIWIDWEDKLKGQEEVVVEAQMDVNRPAVDMVLSVWEVVGWFEFKLGE